MNDNDAGQQSVSDTPYIADNDAGQPSSVSALIANGEQVVYDSVQDEKVDALDASGERSIAETARGFVRRIQSHDRSSQAASGSIANVQAPGEHRLEDDIPQECGHHDSSSHLLRTTVNKEKGHGAAEGAEGAILGKGGVITKEQDVGDRNKAQVHQQGASGGQSEPTSKDPDVIVKDNADTRDHKDNLRLAEDKPETKTDDDPWSLCAKEVWNYEDNQINKWKENINNLLLFAGLFSTILTGFIVAFYLLLGPTTPDTTTQVLIVVSMQLSILTAAIAHSNLTQSQQSVLQAASATIPPTTSTISTGVLWFVALIFSLSAASISIALGEWLHHHTDRASSMSRQSVRIWAMRRRSLEKWHVRIVIDLLPVLLQISLALFLIGLLELLWALSHVVAAIVTALVIILLLPTLVTVFLPYFFADCPYKSRAAWLCFTIFRRAARASPYRLVKQLVSSMKGHSDHLCKVAKLFMPWLKHHCNDFVHTVRRLWSLSWLWTSPMCIAWLLRKLPDRGRAAYQKWKAWDPEALRYWRKWQSDTRTARNWREFENQLARAEVLQEKDKLMVLAEADELIMDDAFLSEVVQPCLQQSSLESALPVLLRILRHRAHKVSEVQQRISGEFWPIYQWFTSEQDSIAIIAMGDLCLDVLTKDLDSLFYNEDHIADHLLQLIRAMPPTESCRAFCRRAAHHIQMAAQQEYVLHESRIDVLDDGADACFLEFVVTAWYKALAPRPYINALDRFYNVLAGRWDSISTMDSKTAAATADLTLDLLLKLPLHPQARNLLDRLLTRDFFSGVTSFSGSASSHYTRLIDNLCTTQSTDKSHDTIALWIFDWCRSFSLDIEYTRKFLAYLLTACDHLSTETFLQIASSALRHSAKHSSADFCQIYDDVKSALDIVARYFSSSDIDKVVRKITTEMACYTLDSLLDACGDLAQKDADLFDRGIVMALARCVRRVPKRYSWRFYISVRMSNMYTLTGITAKSIQQDLDEEWQTRDAQVASHAVNEQAETGSDGAREDDSDTSSIGVAD